MSVLDRLIQDTPISVIDFETTGLTAGRDRVVEASVVRLEPAREPELVFDTLVNPERRVSCTEIHGITDHDVADAPIFADVAPEFVRALEGSVVAAYNVYFDQRFLADELRRAGLYVDIPHICLMYMRPLLDLGARCSLSGACEAHGVPYDGSHHAGVDALAAAGLLPTYLRQVKQLGVQTYADLADRKSYKFLNSLDAKLPTWPTARASAAVGLKSRAGLARSSTVHAFKTGGDIEPKPDTAALHTYTQAITAAIADRMLEPAEIETVASLQRSLRLSRAQLRVVHAAVFAAAIEDAIEDGQVERDEVRDLRQLRECLSHLGWAPGE